MVNLNHELIHLLNKHESELRAAINSNQLTTNKL